MIHLTVKRKRLLRPENPSDVLSEKASDLSKALKNVRPETAIQELQKSISTPASTPPVVDRDSFLSEIPLDLKRISNWVSWRLEAEDGKVPYIAGTSQHASVKDPTTWKNFDAVIGTPLTSCSGVGFVLGGESKKIKLNGIDLDGCVSPEGKITEWARMIVDLLRSYTEKSPSGTGLRIWIRGLLPNGDRMFKLEPSIGHGRKVQIEIFDELKYFTITGNFIEDPSSGWAYPLDYISNMDMASFYQRVYNFRAAHPAPKKTGNSSSNPAGEYLPVQVQNVAGSITTKLELMTSGTVTSDTPLIIEDKAGAKIEYPSASEADMALCTLLAMKYGDNEHAIDADFRRSSLYRQKWERDDYRENTIDKAIKTALRLKAEEMKTKPASTSTNLPMQATESPIADVENLDGDGIPPFDPSTMCGVCKEITEVLIAGTTLAPQFVYRAVRTYLGLRMAGKVVFADLDMEPRYYTAFIGETGSGKGEAWRRLLQLLEPRGLLDNMSGIKIINGSDSGAGLKDAFFEEPVRPILCFIDEVVALGNQAADTRNPSIVDTFLTLADSTSISRTLAKPRGSTKVPATKSMNNARLALILCGQSGTAYMKAFAGRSDAGWFDRVYPEYGVAQESGKMPPIDPVKAIKLMGRINGLDFSGTMTNSPSVDARLEEFWMAQPATIRKKNRWKKQLQMDAYISAFSRGVWVVELEDLEREIRTFTRQLLIRKFSFTSEVPDVTGYYIGLIKNIMEEMVHKIKRGLDPLTVALSKRDFMNRTNAYRANEEHFFNRAWDVFSKDFLAAVPVTRANGHSYMKYLPAEEDPGE